VRRHGEAKQWDQLHAAHRAGDAATKGGEA